MNFPIEPASEIRVESQIDSNLGHNTIFRNYRLAGNKSASTMRYLPMLTRPSSSCSGMMK